MATEWNFDECFDNVKKALYDITRPFRAKDRGIFVV
jgi:hypothetical protein